MFYSEEAAYDYTLSHDDRGYNQQPASPATMPQPKQASSATRELDDLMATLSEFKVGFERSDMQLFSYILNHLIEAANISHVV